MLSEVCHELRNWFDISRLFGKFEVKNGVVTSYLDSSAITIADGQYFRIVGSVFNDGVWEYSSSEGIGDLVDEVFDGAVWLLAIPREVIALSERIDEWKNKYAGVGSAGMSPFQSESFGGYSYSKQSAGGDGTAKSFSWQNAFANDLNQWRKI